MLRRTFFGRLAAAISGIFAFSRAPVAKASGPHTGDEQSIASYPSGTIIRPREGVEYVPGPISGTTIANWVSVKDRLPPRDSQLKVLGSFVALNGNGPVVTMFMAEEFHDETLLRRDGFAPTLTHWAELPSAPPEAVYMREEILAELSRMPQEEMIARRVQNPDGSEVNAICWIFDAKLCAISWDHAIGADEWRMAEYYLEKQRRKRAKG